MKMMKRTLAMLLALVMIVGVLPMSVLADEYGTGAGEFTSTVVDAFVVMSDLHIGTNSTDKEALVKNVLTAIKNDGKPVSSVASAGDMFSSNQSPMSGNASKVTGYVQQVFNVPVNYVWTDHDRAATDISKESRLVYSGNYYVYLLSMADTGSWDRYSAGFYSDAEVAAHIEAFKTTVAGLDKSKPLFIVGHQPLYNRRGDNARALEWVTAINEVAKDMDVAYFFGHNHNYDKPQDYYYAKGSEMPVPTSKGDGYNPAPTETKVKLNFTHISAGYMDPGSQYTNGARLGTAMVVTIYNDKINFTTYDSTGKYTGNYAVNEDVSRGAAVPKSLAVTGKIDYVVGDAVKAPTEVKVTYMSGSVASMTEGYELSKITKGNAEYPLDGFTFPEEGTYTLTYTCTVGSYRAQAALEVTVASNAPVSNTVYTHDGDYYIGATGLGLTAITATYAYGEYEELMLSTFDNGTGVAYEITLEGHVADSEITYQFALDDSVPVQNLGLYYVTEGQTVPVDFELVKEDGVDLITFKTAYVGTFVYGTVNVPEGYTFAELVVKNTGKTNYFVGESYALYMVDVVAVYKNEAGQVFERPLAEQDGECITDGYTWSNIDMSVAGEKTVTFTYAGQTVSVSVGVWNKDFATGDVTVEIGEGEFGVSNVTVTESANTYVPNAIAPFVKGTNYRAYDITMAFADGFETTGTRKTVKMPIPEGVTNPVVYYVSNDGKTVEFMSDAKVENGYIIFTTTHFSTYVVGEGVEITVPESVTVNGSLIKKKTVYALTDTISAGNSYLIANSSATSGNKRFLMIKNGNSIGATAALIKSDGNRTYIDMTEAEAEAAGALWTVGSGWTFENGDRYLGYTTSGIWNTFGLSDTAHTWSYSTEDYLLSTSVDNYYSTTTYYLRYNSGWTWTSDDANASQIYFFVATEIEDGTIENGTFSIEVNSAEMKVVVENGDTATLGATVFFRPYDSTEKYVVNDATITYEVVDGGDPNGVISVINGNTVTFTGNYGKALVKVSCDTNGNEAGGVVTNYIVVEASAPYYTMELNKKDGDKLTEITAPVALKGIKANDTYSVWAVIKKHNSQFPEGEDLGALDDHTRIKWTVSNTSIATIDETTGIIKFTGKQYGTFDVIAIYRDEYDNVLCQDSITISVTETQYVVPGDGTDDFPEYPDPGAIRFDKTATAVGAFSQTGMAQVELSMTGVPIDKGIDVIVMLDTSSSMTRCIYCSEKHSSKPNDCENGYRSRLTELNLALDNMIKTFGAKNPDGSFKHDIRIAIRDFNGAVSGATSRDTADRTVDAAGLTGAAALTEFTGSGLGVDAFVDFDENYEALLEIEVTKTASGTNYDYAFDAIYQMGQAIKEANGENERELYVIFMSDGSPNYYNYYGSQGGDSATSGSDDWNYWLTGAVGKSVSVQNADGTTKVFNGTNIELNDIVNTPSHYHYFHEETGNQHRMANAVKGDPLKRYEIIRKATGLHGMESTGETNMYTVPGLGATVYSVAFTPANDGRIQKEAMLHVLRNVATSTQDHYFEAADAGALTEAFGDIATNILEAATNVKVEDKIGKDYTVNFGLPTPDFDRLPNADMGGIDGEGSTEFYMQVLNYKLDPATNERIPNQYTVLEKFTFNLDGSLKSHTVGGNACGTTCTHVTTSGGKITKIDGTYFDFEDKGDEGQFMHWTADRLTRDELVLQYFVYLEDSADDEIPAGTYYTNEYATLTYTNYKGNEVQQEFPIPQLTWNGAQVRYVFYLVNEQGQPVNRQGQVVPFADAVYVTDIFVDSMTWNDLQHYESFDAALKAENLLPDVYELYDKNASYNIHVFESEYGSDLNNHFFIGSSFTQEQVDAHEKAWTTFVFNNKSDAIKYAKPGYYSEEKPFGCTSVGKVTLGTNGKPTGYTRATGEGAQMVVSYSAYNGRLELTSEEQEELKNKNVNQFNAWVLIRTADWYVQNGNDYYLYYQDQDGNWYTIVQRSESTIVHDNFDFGNTAVAFAVVWKPGLKEDTVVVDFGLDVVIDVITNDVMIPGVIGLSSVPREEDELKMNSFPYEQRFTTEKDKSVVLENADGIVIGTASITGNDTAHVRFTFNKDYGMQFNQPVSFYYEAKVEYYDNTRFVTRYMYSKVTIIPATTIYYEDSFLTLESYTKAGNSWNKDKQSQWETAGNTLNGTQAQDRPGASQISKDIDADNNYGYDAAYQSMSQYSMGSAAKITVDKDHYGLATFTFAGTGFDVISLTSSATGSITVKVYDKDGKQVRNLFVDTYYGYVRNDKGEWVATTSNNPNALYQVPVITVKDLTYGTYSVVITAAYNSAFDHQAENGAKTQYDLYLDAIRIYDPTGNRNGTANDAYVKDGEGWPTYVELRDLVIDATGVTVDKDGKVTIPEGAVLSGPVFIDGISGTDSVENYISYGPNNELYLENGQKIAFVLNKNGADFAKTGFAVDKVQLAFKSVGGTGHIVIKDTDGKVYYDMDVATATDMYYDISELNGKDVIIQSTGSAIISLTNIKVTYKVVQTTSENGEPPVSIMSLARAAKTEEEETYLISVNAEMIERVLNMLNGKVEVEPERPFEPAPGKPSKPGSGNKPVAPKPSQPIKPSVPAKPIMPVRPVVPTMPVNPGLPGIPGRPAPVVVIHIY